MASTIEMDYYKILEVDRDATTDDIRAAYRQLAIKWHPDKNLNKVVEAEAKFKQILEAYQVLIDPKKRLKYDRNRESNSSSRATATKYGESSSCNTEQNACASQYSQYGAFNEALLASIFRWRGNPKLKAPPIEYRLVCTLEELYSGTVKTIRLTRDVLVSSGRKIVATEMLTMNILPGARKGTRFIFEEKGSEAPNTTPADIIVTIDQEPHAVYTRQGDDLIISETISLWEVFTCSCTLDLTTLDGRKLAVPINCVSFPPFREKIIPREGMPSTKDPSVRGALRIKLNLKMF